MIDKISNQLLLLLSIACILLVSGCSTTNTSITTAKFSVVYEEYHDNGTIIAGNGTVSDIPVPCPVPLPFDNTLINQTGQRFATSDPNFKMLYTTYYYRDYPYGGYATSYDHPVDGFPYTLESNFTVISVDENGTLQGSYQGQNVTLKPGDKWQSSNTSRTQNLSLQVVVNNNPMSGIYQPFTVQYTTYWTVENKGLFDKTGVNSG